MSDDISEYERIANDAANKPQKGEWISTKQALREAFARNQGKLTPEQGQIIDEFWDAVKMWVAGEIDVDQFDTVTGDGWLRAQVIMNSSLDHPLYGDAMRVLDFLIFKKGEPAMFTRHGWFTVKEVEEAGGRILREVDQETGELRERIQFPVGVDEVTGRTIWPSTTFIKGLEPEAPTYVSPFRRDWQAGSPEQDSDR